MMFSHTRSREPSLRAVALLVMLLALAACWGCHPAPATIRRTARVGDIELIVRVDPAVLGSRVLARCEVSVEVLSPDARIVGFFDPALPTVLCTPGAAADVFFGLSPMPKHVDHGMEVLSCRLMAAGFPYRRVITLWNPLDERAPYGNPWRDDPESPYHIRAERSDPDSSEYDELAMRRALTWRAITVRVGYLDLVTDGQAFKDDVRRRLFDGATVQVDNWQTSVLRAQREVCLTLDLSAFAKQP